MILWKRCGPGVACSDVRATALTAAESAARTNGLASRQATAISASIEYLQIRSWSSEIQGGTTRSGTTQIVHILPFAEDGGQGAPPFDAVPQTTK
ncbi:hypothetical protein GCM10023307_09980 [Lysobacter hankyongensis]|uniref:Uncharacterized protein n=1 Tax=Lysobacter hankyongensis TaxID=1176535 RepID=A0ABP9AVV6_9GAMM